MATCHQINPPVFFIPPLDSLLPRLGFYLFRLSTLNPSLSLSLSLTQKSRENLILFLKKQIVTNELPPFLIRQCCYFLAKF